MGMMFTGIMRMTAIIRIMIMTGKTEMVAAKAISSKAGMNLIPMITTTDHRVAMT